MSEPPAAKTAARALVGGLLAPRPRRLAVLLIGLVTIAAWQSTFVLARARLDPTYRNRAAGGLTGESRFVYFLYYLGLYPVATEIADPEDSREGARRIVRERGDTLLMEVGYAMRYGDQGRAFLYLPHAWARGTPARAQVRPLHAGVFVAGLMALFSACWWVRLPLAGAAAVAVLGSNPFQLYEVYANENLFGWPISTTLLVLALHLRLLAGGSPAPRYAGALPVVTGVLLGTIRQVRAEPALAILSAAFAYLSLAEVRWSRRLALVGVLGATFAVTSAAWPAYFSARYAAAEQVVRAAGGHPYPGPRLAYHDLWQVVWTGLGDYDRKYGYNWDDRHAGWYAAPVLRARYGVVAPRVWPVAASDPTPPDYWDPEHEKYPKRADEAPHHYEVLRDKVLHDIAHDPVWYAGILARRAGRLLTETTPVQLALGPWALRIPMPGLLVIPVLAAAALARAWALVRLTAFLLPLSLPALLVYSDRGMTFYSCYHLVPAVVGLGLGLEAAANAAARRRTCPTSR